MFDVKISIKLIIVDLALYLFGILVWFNGDFAHALGFHGLGRLFAGLVSIGLALLLTKVIF